MKLSLEEWAKAQFGKHVPCLATLRHWARDGQIFPAPQKIGRKWLVDPDAKYVEVGQLVPTRPTPDQLNRSPLIRRIMEKANGTPPNRKKQKPAAQLI